MNSEINYELVAKEVFETVNRLRREPQAFVSDLSEMRKNFNGNDYRSPRLDFSIYTEEGVSAVDDAIKFLSECKPAPVLTRTEELDKSAKILAEYIGPQGLAEFGSGELSFDRRLASANCERVTSAECMSLGWSTGKEIVLQLLIDDGNTMRSNRKNIFREDFLEIGVFACPHKVYSHCCIIDFQGRRRSAPLDFDRYAIEQAEWPPNTISLEKKLERTSKDGITIVRLTYEFLTVDGQTIVQTKEFVDGSR